jgi:hypothetical protein
MKMLTQILMIILVFSISCKSQEINEDVYINYTAQTRGYVFILELKNNELSINNNQVINKTNLTENQKSEVLVLLSKINFKKLENNISTNDLAVDKAINGDFTIHYKNKQYSYNFNHIKLPKDIEELKLKLESF